MGGLIAALATLAQPILARVLLALGFSVVTLIGVSSSVSVIIAKLMERLHQIPSEPLQLAGLAGVWDALAIMLASVSFSLAYWAATRAVKIAGA